MSPTADELLIVRAAVAEGRAALDAWDRYCRIDGGIDRVQGEAFQLLPQVYRSLRSASYAGAELGRLKGIYRQTWYANSVLRHAAARASATLGARGVGTMLIGRTALLATHAAELGTRPMDAVDLLVGPADVQRAVGALRADGWSLTRGPTSAHPVRLENQAGANLRLHWSGLVRRRDHERRVWSDAARVQLDESGTLVPNVTDQLVFICAGGFGWAPARLRWIVDALLLVRADGDRIAWDDLVARAHASGKTLRFSQALTLLVSEFDLELPPETVHALRTVRVGAGDRLLQRVARSRRQQSALWRIVRRPASAWATRQRLAELRAVHGDEPSRGGGAA